jgi:hypothetical protein
MTKSGASAHASFAGFDVRIDPWAVEYGAETPTEFQSDSEDELGIDIAVERSADAWAAVVPTHWDLPEELAIVDGVRRMEARLVVTKSGRVLHGALGTYGVGLVHCRNGHATFGEELRGRVVIFGGGEIPPDSIAVSPGLVYAPRSVPEEDSEAPLRGLHREMRVVEEQFARRLAADASRLVLADGPLSI